MIGWMPFPRIPGRARAHEQAVDAAICPRNSEVNLLVDTQKLRSRQTLRSFRPSVRENGELWLGIASEVTGPLKRRIGRMLTGATVDSCWLSRRSANVRLSTGNDQLDCLLFVVDIWSLSCANRHISDIQTQGPLVPSLESITQTRNLGRDVGEGPLGRDDPGAEWSHISGLPRNPKASSRPSRICCS
jgi:hypothetical protein